jgi:hypothetical protein
MLDCKVLELDHGVSYGSVTLKSLQNDYIPELDLLVREAIQNSSDASLGETDDNFKVNFNTGYFCPSCFNEFMTGLDARLNSLFPGNSAEFLEIRDTKTCGLTGYIHKADITDDDHGNFFKLIFDTGKRQTQAGAGGNWGFGKSVYYRVGIGIVIFYSRVRTADGRFESRLIITLVEDESKKNPDGSNATLLHELSKHAVGKAWWGIKDKEDFLPITDQEFINAVLNVFKLSPFKETETGTSIIIPYIDPKRLLGDIIPHEAGLSADVVENFISVWGHDVESYLRLAIQKWYAPKIHNRALLEVCNDQKWLHVSVNNRPIRKDDMLPFFKLVQELYTSALAKTKQAEYTPHDADYEILTRPVNLNNCFVGGGTAGHVAVAKVSKQQLCGDSLALSPYVYCGRFEAEGGQNEPIMMYTREPGMVIEYAISGLWVKGIPWPESEDDYLIAFFVPDTAKQLKPDLEVKEHAGKTLGEYLRSCEASDHMGWSDPAKMTVVIRIQKNTAAQIVKLQNAGEEKRVEATASRLSSKLGKLLMPRVGYAKGNRPGNSGGSGGSGGGSVRNLSFEILNQSFSGKDLEIEYRIKMMHTKKSADISLVIESEGGRIDPESWQQDIGTPFPATIISASVSSIGSTELSETEKIDAVCTRTFPEYTAEKISFNISKEEKSSEYTSFSVRSRIIGPEILGTLKIHARDKRYSFSFKVV